MTNLVKQAIEVLRDLPEDWQDKVARAIIGYAALDDDDYRLSDDERVDVRVGLDQANRGQFVSDADVQRYRSRDDA